MKTLACIILFSLFLISGCGRSDLENLQGEWKEERMAGWFTFYLPPTMGGQMVLQFAGTRFDYRYDSQRIEGTFSCDLTKTPPQITFDFEGRKVVGIYSLSGGKLKICVGEKDNIPPDSFEGGPMERPALLIFRR